MTKNLNDIPYPGKLAVTTRIDKLYKKAGDDAYQLSMPLLASAQQGNTQQYEEILPKMKKALANIPDDGKQNSYKAWLLGRVLLAADSIGDKDTVAKTQKKLQDLLENKVTIHDEFYAWSLGYLAALNEEEYNLVKKDMLNSAQALTEKYQQTKKDASEVTSKESTQSQLSNALWAWVMDLQAAANGKDKTTYEKIVEEIKSLTGKTSVAEALSTGLLRTSASNDYPAWALSIVSLAAATRNDSTLYNELSAPLATAIAGAKTHNAPAEETLAQLNAELAKIRLFQSSLTLTTQATVKTFGA